MDAIQVVMTVKKYGHEVVQIGKPLFFWQSPSRGEHIGVNGFAIAQAVVELRSILSSNFSYSMLFKWLRLSKNKVTKLFKSASRYFSDNLHPWWTHWCTILRLPFFIHSHSNSLPPSLPLSLPSFSLTCLFFHLLRRSNMELAKQLVWCLVWCWRRGEQLHTCTHTHTHTLHLH